MIEVSLTRDEWAQAVFVALLRQHHSLHRSSADSLYEKPWMAQLEIHMLGACGELAAAKAIGLPWPSSVNTYKGESDLPGGIEVRHRTKSHYDLIVRDDDPDDRRYVLTLGEVADVPKIKVVGWFFGSYSGRHRYLHLPVGSYPTRFSPDAVLGAIEELA